MTQIESGGGVAFKGSVGFCYQKKGVQMLGRKSVFYKLEQVQGCLE